MKNRENCLSSLLILIICSISFSCTSYQNDDSWSSMDPLSIPLSARQDWYRKGNLAPNPSFEQCEVFKNDSSITHFNLSGWKVIGKGVQLTDITRKGVYDSADASQGIHAIKIIRTERDVTEINNPKEGVESDLISVIPGNYDFYFYIRLKDIIPSTYPYNRFNTRIGENIDVRLKFYDKDKEEISPETTLEYRHVKIDNGFKGYAFSNYFYISNFNWGKVRGEAWHYPFSEGDLPDNCRYVKIFLGLACPGTMWIDDIDFHLSRWNFTPLERMDSFFKKKYDLADLLLPTPQSVTNKQPVSLKNKPIELINPENNLLENSPAIRLLKKQFTKIKGDAVKVLSSDNGAASSNKLQIIFIDHKKSLSPELENAFSEIRDKEQGYFIRKTNNKIYLGANQPVGWYYAACTLSQLIDDDNATLDYADITDYPDFTGRSALLSYYYKTLEQLEQSKSVSDSAIQSYLIERDQQLKQQLKDIDFYAFYKLNDLYNSYSIFSMSKRWWQPDDFYNKYFKTIGNYCSENYNGIMHLGIQFNPYGHLPMWARESTLSDSLRGLFSHGSPESFDKIINVLKPALDAGARTVMFRADDHMPHIGLASSDFTLFTKSDKEQFTNLAAAQTYLLNKLKLWLDKNYGNVRLEFLPPPYSNRFIDNSQGSAETYFRDMNAHLDSSVVFQWTGPAVRSLSYDMADLDRVAKVYKRKPMIYDNSPYTRITTVNYDPGYPINYPLKSVMCNLFEPLDMEYPHDFPSYLDSHYYFNNRDAGEINKIKNIPFADFSWNTKDYNPDFSLFKVLIKYVGEKNAMLLLRFNDAYFKLVASWGQLKMNIENNPGYKLSREQRQNADQEIKAVQEVFDSLSPMENIELKQQLKKMMNTEIEDWNKLVKAIK